ncbi:MAG: FAD-binding protein [Candidatus Lokiarchaeota archaeon]|nr:FAD-binding protein [Candidatus Lokiarchaeota archaeon]
MFKKWRSIKLSDKVLSELKTIFSDNNVSNSIGILKSYESDASLHLVSSKLPSYVVWPENIKQIQQLISLADKNSFSLVPTSSEPPRFYGTSIARKKNSIIVDFTKMKKILKMDKRNRVTLIESGVNFEEYIKECKKAGLRPHIPLYPYAKKSVVGASLDREPVTIPKYHWDISDPLLCTELVFGTGNMFRTGAAAGPGNLDEQREAGGAQKNPMGPSQFSPFRIVQGSQGSIGLVTWASLKVDRAIDSRKNFFAISNNLDTNFDFIYEILKYRLGDELFLVNNLNLAILVGDDKERINQLKEKLPKWIVIISVTGIGELASEKIDWQKGDIHEYSKTFEANLTSELADISDNDISRVLEEAAPQPWRLKYLGGCDNIFFITTLDKTKDFKKIMFDVAREEGFNESNIGVYIQPMIQGCNVHCEFDLYYDPKNDKENRLAKKTFLRASEALIDSGAFFNRPYGIWADMIYPKTQDLVIESMKKVKDIFDPNNILCPGVLCFKEDK